MPELMRRFFLAFQASLVVLLVTLACLLPREARAEGPLEAKAVPDPLKPWTTWALHGKETALCPTLNGISGSARCVWPAKLALSLEEKRGTFTQTWHVDAKGWVPLPGNEKRWPLDVKIGNARAVVVARDGVPSVELDRGDHVVSGSFAWDSLPESIQVPRETALLALALRGKAVEQPNRDASGTVWLQKTLAADEGERLDFVVHRRLVDDVPALLTTRVILNVAGRNREVILGRALPPGFVPMALTSGLPARVEPDMRLRVQVRPGTWTIDLVARSEGPLTEVKRPEPDGPWRTGEEVWVFDARTNLRVVDVQGVAAIDPQQTSLPDDWKALPAYPMNLTDKLRLVEKRRGNGEVQPDHLRLTRTLWLDFDGRGFTASDALSGTLRRASRLEMLPPTVLGRVAIGGKDQFITHLEGEAAKTGVEVRQGELSVSADSRVVASPNDFPIVGWNHDFHEVSATLNLPPGYRLLHATGVDDVPSTWLKHWTLLELFLVLVLAIATFRLFGPAWGAIALVTFGLTFPEGEAPKYVFIFVVIAEALVRGLDRAIASAVAKAAASAPVLPTEGSEGGAPPTTPAEETAGRGLRTARKIVSGGRFAIATILVLVTIPFLVDHVRAGLFPALSVGADTSSGGELEGGGGFFNAPTGGLAKSEKAADPAVAVAASAAAVDADKNAPPPPPEAPVPADETVDLKQKPKASKDGSKAEAQNTSTVREEDKPEPPRPGQSAPAGQAAGYGSSSRKMGWLPASTAAPTDYRQFNANVYDPNSMVQTGPGRPRWSFTQIPLRWSGPVDRTQRLHLYLLSPAVNAVLAILRVVLLVALVLRMIPVKPKRDRGEGGRFVLRFATTALLFAATTFAATTAHAQAVPPKEVLDDLASRMLEKPTCLPNCASSSRMLIEARPGVLRVRLEVEASAATAIALPTSTQWSPETVLVDGKPAHALVRTDDGKVWLAVEKGWHQAILEGSLPDRELVQISLPQKPHRVEASAEGWRVEGIHEDGLADDNLQLTRIRTQRGAGGTLEPGALPPFVQIERTLLLGLNWQVSTRIVRRSPPGTAIVLEVPLLPGESVTTADVRVVAGKALVNMAPLATETAWTSVLDQRSPVVLSAPKQLAWTELWRLDASPIWHVDFAGIPVVAPSAPSATLPEWRPWPGETATLKVTRPDGVAGRTLTIDESSYEVRPGLRATDSTLTLQVRSSRGAEHVLTLPDGAQVESLTINGATKPTRQEGRKVTLTVAPGPQSVVLKWRTNTGMATIFRAPPLDLGTASVNATTQIVMPEGRWVLGLEGPRLGPVVLFWSLLAILLVVSAAIGAMRRTPIAIWQWLLLAIGLSQVHITAGAFVVLWLHLVAWREKSTDVHHVAFNLRQIAIAVATVIALVLLLVAVHQGLLGHPEMQVRGNGSSASQFRWFTDRSEALLASPLVVSVPLAVYRGAMLAWALWLALTIVRWLRWAFTAFGTGGFWQKTPPRTVPAVPDQHAFRGPGFGPGPSGPGWQGQGPSGPPFGPGGQGPGGQGQGGQGPGGQGPGGQGPGGPGFGGWQGPQG